MHQHPQTSSSLGQTSTAQLPELLTAKELEAFLRIDVKTIYGYASTSGELDAIMDAKRT